MTIELKPEDTRIIKRAIQAGLIHCPDDVVEVGVATLRSRLQSCVPAESSTRQEAVRRMQEFGDEYRLSIGEPITRQLLHEGHRF
jgi:hypothetical protein